MPEPKRVIYRYGGDACPQEVIEDLHDEILVPHRNDLILRKGKKWVVKNVMTERTRGDIPTVWIFLAEKF